MVRHPRLRPLLAALIRGALLTPLMAAACGTGDTAEGTRAERARAATAAAAPVAASTPAPAAPTAAMADTGDAALVTRADQGRLLGNEKAMWVVMISDFQCPYCRQWHDQSMANLRRDYIDKGTVRMVYLQFPLNTHRHAKAEAVASLCAGAQGRFWEYADSLFARQETVGKMTDVTPLLTRLGRDLRLDAGQFDACRRSPAIEALLQNDVQQALRAGVRSTPTFLIGDFLVEGAIPWTDFRRAVDTALVVARTRPRGGAGGPAQP
jgi:protein-disulfide isomerase